MGQVGEVLGALLMTLVLHGVILGFVGTAIVMLPLRAFARAGRGSADKGASPSGVEGTFRDPGIRRLVVTIASPVVALFTLAGLDGVSSGFIMFLIPVFGTLVFWKASDWTWRRIWGENEKQS